LEKSVELKKPTREAILKYLDYSILESKKYGKLFIPSKHDYGLSVWSVPLSQDLELQRTQGLGSELVRPILEESDGLGIPTYLETFSPRNKSFYMRLGYEEAASIYEPTTKSKYSIMKRDAKNLCD